MVLLAGVGDVVGPALSAPLLVGVEKRDIFEVRGLTIDDRLPIVHPRDLGCAAEFVSPLGSRDTVVLLGECKTTLACTTGLERSGLSESGETTKGQKEGSGKHSE